MAELTIASIPALITSGNSGQASITWLKSLSEATFWDFSGVGAAHALRAAGVGSLSFSELRTCAELVSVPKTDALSIELRVHAKHQDKRIHSTACFSSTFASAALRFERA